MLLIFSFKITPYFIGFYVAISMLRASGFFDSCAQALSPLLTSLQVPAEVIPLMIVRPFSGAATTGMLADLAKTHGWKLLPCTACGNDGR